MSELLKREHRTVNCKQILDKDLDKDLYLNNCYGDRIEQFWRKHTNENLIWYLVIFY